MSKLIIKTTDLSQRFSKAPSTFILNLGPMVKKDKYSDGRIYDVFKVGKITYMIHHSGIATKIITKWYDGDFHEEICNYADSPETVYERTYILD